MNSEVIKAMNKKSEEERVTYKIRRWWYKNDYKVYRIIFFPIWLLQLCKEWYEKKENAKFIWDEKKANEILNYYIPRKSDWDNDVKEFYFFDNGYGWSMDLAKKYLKRSDRKFWKYNKTEIRRFLIDSFELDGFSKELGECSWGWTEIVFKLIEKNA